LKVSALISAGANIIALDIDIPRIWERLISIARNSPGSITFPLKKPVADNASDVCIPQHTTH
jgi:hypothetical protein